MKLFLEILALGVVSFCMHMIADVYRTWQRRKIGPNQQEFANAVVTIARYIDHHNAHNPKQIITSVKVSRNGVYAMGPGGQLELTS